MRDWDDLKYFVAVARYGSTLAAAKALGLSQSTVHRRLEMLEKQLGRQLVKRHPNGYRLTETGEAMRAYAEQVEDAVLTFERQLAATETELSGAVRITCPEAVGYRLMRSALPDKFSARYPKLRLEFVMTDRIVELAKGEADIALRATAPAETALVGRKIADPPWAIYASRAYAERHGRPQRKEELNRHALVGFDGALKDHAVAKWLRSAAPNAKIAARATSVAAVLMAVKSGAGIAPLPVIMGDEDGDLVKLLGPYPGLSTPFYLFMHEDMRRTPRVRAFFDFAISEARTIRKILEGKSPTPSKDVKAE